MNDAERDAWLREALRHAPDSDALPPSGVSEAILLKARAAARAAQPSARRAAAQAAPTNAFAAFWAWLARPPVAAGFASVMAATLVGLMWWDRPMDETMPRPPALTSERSAAPPLASPAPAPAPTPAAPEAPTNAAKATPPARTEPATPSAQSQPTTTAAAADDEIRRRQQAAPEQAGARDAKVAAPATTAKRKADADDALAQERALTAERKNEAPAPFPSTQAQRETAPARQPVDKAANEAAKKVAEASRTRSTDAVEQAALPPAAQSVAPAAAPVPAPVARPAPAGAAPAPTAPLASGRLAADEGRPAGAANNADAAMAKSAAGTAPSPAAPATPAAPARDIAAAPPAERAQGQRALGGARDKDAAGFSSSTSAPAPAPFRNELERVRPDAATRADASIRAAPLAKVLAAIAADPERWSRQTAGGDIFAIDAGWRAWLAELDAAAAGRWRPLGGADASTDAGAARDGAATLRLVSASRVAAVVRFDGVTVHVDAAPGSGADRWQATLSPATAERLRTTARRLSP